MQWFVGFFIVATIFLQIYKFHWSKVTLVVGDELVTVQVAKTIYQQHKGLGKRDSIGKYDGMLFVFGHAGKHSIVMREMRFPIDIIWVYDGKIVDIAQNISPEPGVPERALMRYYPRTKANTVLEFPAGWAATHDIQLGDTVSQIHK